MSTVRLRRLHADHQKLVAFVTRHPRLRLIQTQGDPPELYQLEYCINSLRQTDEGLVASKSHIAEIALPRDYPRTPPQCRMLTPIFHPSIAPHAICIGDHWAAGEPLWSMVARIGEMIAYQSYNTKSPLNGEAARWVESNLNRLPLDPVSMMIDEAETAARPVPPVVATPLAKPAASVVAPAVAATVTAACPRCHTRYRVPAANVGKRASCKQCQTVFRISEADRSHERLDSRTENRRAGGVVGRRLPGWGTPGRSHSGGCLRG